MDTIQKPIKKLRAEVLLLLIIIISSILLRLFINFSNELMPGVNGMYYPVQVRALIETGTLGFPDFPLVFWLEAAVAQIFTFIGVSDLSDSIITASKLIDSLLPPLTGVAAYFLAKSIMSKQKEARESPAQKWIPLLIAAYSVLCMGALVMTADFTKNALGLTWAMFFFYFVYKAAQASIWKNYILAGFFFILAGLTHLSTLGLAIFFLVIFIVTTFILDKEKRKALLIKSPLIIIPLAIFLGVMFMFIDPERIERLLDVILLPTMIFRDSVLISAINGQSQDGFFILIESGPTNFIGLLGIITLISKRKSILKVDKIFLISSIIVSLFTASPMLGPDWADRLGLISYIPAIIILIYFLAYTYSSRKRILFGGILGFSILLTMVGLFEMRQRPNISHEAYKDLYEVKKSIDDPDNSLVIARHGLEWWVAWTLETDVAEHETNQDIWDAYSAVYYLKQISGKIDSGLEGPGGGFAETQIPEEAEIVFEDEFFVLGKMDERPQYRYDPNDPYFDPNRFPKDNFQEPFDENREFPDSSNSH